MNGPGTPEQASLLDAQRAESYLRQRAGEELAEADSLAQVQASADDRAATAKACVARAAALAGALAAVGAIAETAASSVLQGLGAALVQRGLLPAAELPAEPATELPAELPDTPSRRLDAVRAFPAGVTVECEISGFGFPLRIRLGALVTDGQSARVTWRAAYTDPQLTGPEAPFEAPDPRVALRGVTSVDDLGGSYQDMGCTYFGRFRECGHFRWEGWSRLDAAPPDEARWLEVTLAGRAPVRIEMDRARELAGTAAALDPAGAAGRYVDAGSMTLLADYVVERAGMRPLNAAVIAADLLAAGVLQPGDPALARLAAVARHRGLALPGQLAAIPSAPLPDDWAFLADRICSEKGASGVVFAAAALPEVDGVRCVITELASRADITTLRVFAPAWPLIEHHGTPPHDDRFHWEARDDLGRRYAITAYRGGGGIGGAEFPLRLHPPVDLQARELEITLAGRTAQGSVRVPLDWQSDDWEPDLPDWQADS